MMINETTPLKNELEKHIRKLIKPLKDEDELAAVLKIKLTKKEYKVLKTWANNENLEELFEKISLDEERYKTLKEKLIKKLNQEKFKQEVMI